MRDWMSSNIYWIYMELIRQIEQAKFLLKFSAIQNDDEECALSIRSQFDHPNDAPSRCVPFEVGKCSTSSTTTITEENENWADL